MYLVRYLIAEINIQFCLHFLKPILQFGSLFLVVSLLRRVKYPFQLLEYEAGEVATAEVE